MKTKDGTEKPVGECESVEPLTFCKVYQAGHMVPMDQPESAFAMLRTFITGDHFVELDPSIFMENVDQATEVIATS